MLDQTKALLETLAATAKEKARCEREWTADQSTLAAINKKLAAEQAELAALDKAVTDAFCAFALALAVEIGIKLPVTIKRPV